MRMLASGGSGAETDRGALGVWVRPPILLIQLSGFGAEKFAELIIEDFDQIMGRKQQAQIFFEMGGMQNYESGLRTHLTSHFAAHRSQIHSLHVFTRSRLVSMGVAVANLALGGLITTHEERASFHAALDAAAVSSRIMGLSSAALAP